MHISPQRLLRKGGWDQTGWCHQEEKMGANGLVQRETQTLPVRCRLGAKPGGLWEALEGWGGFAMTCFYLNDPYRKPGWYIGLHYIYVLFPGNPLYELLNQIFIENPLLHQEYFSGACSVLSLCPEAPFPVQPPNMYFHLLPDRWPSFYSDPMPTSASSTSMRSSLSTTSPVGFLLHLIFPGPCCLTVHLVLVTSALYSMMCW